MRTLWSLALGIGLVNTISFNGAAEPAGTKDSESKPVLAFIGTYTGAKSKGIYSTRFDPANGSLSSPVLVAETINPTFLAVHPKKPWLYAVNETENFQGTRAGALSVYSIHAPDGSLKLLDQKASGGTGPCHVSVDPSGRSVLVANYGSGSVASFKVTADGRLEPASRIQNEGRSVNPQRQSGPHAHQILSDPDNQFVLSCDLGLDKVLVWQFDPSQALLSAHDPAAAEVPAGAGPRHLAMSANGKFVYVLNELNSTVTSFRYEAKAGRLTPFQNLSTLPSDFKGNNSGAEIQVHPSGKFLFTSNRGEDSIAIFSLNNKTGAARYIGRELTLGKTPRHFTLDRTGRWLIAANQDSDNVVVLRVNPKSGQLSPAGHSIEVGRPVCLVFVQ